jgi:hypothetical protein
MRSTLNEIYFSKAKDIMNCLRFTGDLAMKKQQVIFTNELIQKLGSKSDS